MRFSPAVLIRNEDIDHQNKLVTIDAIDELRSTSVDKSHSQSFETCLNDTSLYPIGNETIEEESEESKRAAQLFSLGQNPWMLADQDLDN